MKKYLTKFSVFALVILLFLAAGVCFAPLSVARADSVKKVIFAPVGNLKANEYASRSVIALHVADTDSQDVFYIPESYYLLSPRPLAFAPQIYTVEYAGETFYVDSEYVTNGETSFVADVNFKDDELALSPDVTLTLLDSVTVNSETVSNDTHIVRFLGYNADSTAYYVMAERLDDSPVYGFIPATSVQAFNVPYQARTQKERNALISQSQMPQPEAGDIVPNTSLALRVVLIIGIAIPAVLIALLLFKPSKDKAKPQSKRSGDSEYDRPRKYRDDDTL